MLKEWRGRGGEGRDIRERQQQLKSTRPRLLLTGNLLDQAVDLPENASVMATVCLPHEN